MSEDLRVVLSLVVMAAGLFFDLVGCIVFFTHNLAHGLHHYFDDFRVDRRQQSGLTV